MLHMKIETDYFTVKQLADGVYAAIAKSGEGAWSNAGIIDLGEDLLIFDTFSTPTAAMELRKQAEKITGKLVKYVVNSHYHGDHVFGNQVFEDVTIISTELTHKWCKEKNVIDDVEKEQAEMSQYLQALRNKIENTNNDILRESLRQQYGEMSKILADLPRLKIVLPSLIFEEYYVIRGSKRTVELHCFGGGHTISDTFLYIPEDKIAFMGDIVTDELHVPIYNPEQFVHILREVNNMDITTIVPGHGEVGTLQLCTILENYISFLIEEAKRAHASSLTLDEFISRFHVPTEYMNWKGVNGVKGNLTTVYKFISG
ncbi:MBL fold metallo-hydrolase [Bacillus manliponensis]|uniref:Metallo-beta-lactamase domain-containing protein n=1 Tax=Bacillus manliponensis TaxID=574376 RepID=A0A073KED6_9BACI|nr:MBL fold metallo-hydrolase [Bacillus manliponensis]KEK20683.1 hypothetical protein BAMA_14845 [Bacillus manliponensis]